MKVEQIVAQLFTISKYQRNPKDIAESMKKLAKIGYKAVQISGMGPIDEKDMLQILDGEGMVCCATHEPADVILYKPEKVVDRLNLLNCDITAYPFPNNINFDSIDAVKKFAAQLNAAGEVLYKSGKILAYHNHNLEFKRLAGKTVLEIIYAETDPRYLQGEPDTYWIQNGGGSPVDWCQKLSGRLPIIHYKDYKIDAENKPFYTEIGNGNLNWPAITNAAEEAGCKWFAVEQDVCPGDPFDSLAQSFEFMKNTLCD